MRTGMIAAAVCFSSVFALQNQQTDWSGGAAFPGPVSEWIDEFNSCETIAWLSIPGQIQISSTALNVPVEHLVADGITNPYSADFGDLNNDGFSDIVIGSGQNDGVIVCYGSASGDWTELVLSNESPGAIGIKIADINGDYIPDVAVCSETELQVFFNQGGSTPVWSKAIAGSGYTSLHDVETVDMDEDGDLDLVVSDYDNDRLFWLRNEGGSSPEWTDLTIDSVIDYPCKQYPADLNGDGNMDVVCAAWTGNKIMAFYGSGGADPTWTSQTIDPNCVAAHGTRACDIDSDGDMDVVGVSINGSKVYLYRNDGGSMPSWERETLGTIQGAAMVRLGDIDGDGDDDAISSSWGNAGVAWWENTENGTSFLKHIVKTGGQATSWAMAGDPDNDGDLDVLAVRYQQGAVYWYEVTEFLSSGILESSILDTGEDPQWASFDWEKDVPSGCSLSFQFKSSNNPSAMGEWSEEYYSSAVLSGLVGRYFRYRLNLSSSDPLFSPVVQCVQLNWDPQGIEESERERLISYHNPCTGMITLHASENIQQALAVDVYSSAGRLLLSSSLDSREILEMEGLSSGIYFIQATSAEGIRQNGSVVLLAK